MYTVYKLHVIYTYTNSRFYRARLFSWSPVKYLPTDNLYSVTVQTVLCPKIIGHRCECDVMTYTLLNLPGLMSCTTYNPSDHVSWSLTSLFSTNMAISEMKGQGWSAIPSQWRKAGDILTSTLAAFYSAATQKGKGIKGLIEIIRLAPTTWRNRTITKSTQKKLKPGGLVASYDMLPIQVIIITAKKQSQSQKHLFLYHTVLFWKKNNDCICIFCVQAYFT